jgi:hypothetical protein
MGGMLLRHCCYQALGSKFKYIFVGFFRDHRFTGLPPFFFGGGGGVDERRHKSKRSGCVLFFTEYCLLNFLLIEMCITFLFSIFLDHLF